jgi:hypothetical protein
MSCWSYGLHEKAEMRVSAAAHHPCGTVSVGISTKLFSAAYDTFCSEFQRRVQPPILGGMAFVFSAEDFGDPRALSKAKVEEDYDFQTSAKSKNSVGGR